MRLLPSVGVLSAIGACFVACGIGTAGTEELPGDGGGPVLDGTAIKETSVSSSGGDSSTVHDGDGGTAPDQSSPTDSSVPDVQGMDVPMPPMEVGPPPETGPTCTPGNGCYDIPAGWTLVAFVGSQSSNCPAGWDNPGPQNLVDSPDTINLCGCESCAMQSQPTCAAGSLATSFDIHSASGNTCGTSGSTLANNPPGQCGTDLFVGNYDGIDFRVVPPGASGGACTSAGAPMGQLNFGGQDTVCAPNSPSVAGCNGGQCTPNLPGPYIPCIAQGGNNACPSGPFSQQHVMGTGGTVMCGACSCSLTATCTGVVQLYTDNSCMSGRTNVPANGMCIMEPVGAADAAPNVFNSYMYVASSPTNVTCQTGSSTASVTLTNEQTVCCTQ